ncbi:MAG: hypothetical protein LH614_00040 [Pyrinomonadaceae bacterium]|nr:hypothetical protein [Pyrinomonadaceae bacterium]
MFIFFHDIGMPFWMPYLWLFGLLTCPIFGGIGISYLIRKKYNQSTFVLSFMVFALLFLCCFLIDLLPKLETDFLFYLTFPFGFVATITLVFTGLSYVAYLIGIILNFLAVFGLVGLIEKIIEKRFK